MKLKSYIFQIALAAVGAGFLGSCEDMLEPTSDYVIYENGSHLTTPADTATSLIGIIYKLQAIGDRTNLLGEVRGDLVTLTTQANADLRALANFEVTDENRYNSPRDYYARRYGCIRQSWQPDFCEGNGSGKVHPRMGLSAIGIELWQGAFLHRTVADGAGCR